MSAIGSFFSCSVTSRIAFDVIFTRSSSFSFFPAAFLMGINGLFFEGRFALVGVQVPEEVSGEGPWPNSLLL